MEKTHSLVSASSCERWWNCPGSVRMVKTMPPQPASVFAAEGTAAHELAQLCLTGGYRAFELVGAKSDPINGKQIEFTDEMAEAVQVYLEAIREDQEKYKGQCELEVEKEFILSHIHKDARGTNDANLAVFLTKLIVYDFKYGKGVVVEAEANKQALYYALGALQEGDYDEIEIVIVQPRAIHRDGPVRRWTVSRAYLLDFGRELKEKIAATEVRDAVLVSGDHCQKYFCAALAVCPAVKSRAEKAAMVAFDDAPRLAFPDPASLSPVQLRTLLDMAPLLDAYIKAVEQFALTVANNGGRVEGYKLVSKKSNRQWKDLEATKKKWPKIVVRMVEQVLSPAAVETELAKLMKKKEAVEMVESFCFNPDTGNVLVPLSDPRKEASPKIENVFTESQDIFS